MHAMRKLPCFSADSVHVKALRNLEGSCWTLCCTWVQKEGNFNKVHSSLKRWRIMFTKNVCTAQRKKLQNLILNTQSGISQQRIAMAVLRCRAWRDNGPRKVIVEGTTLMACSDSIGWPMPCGGMVTRGATEPTVLDLLCDSERCLNSLRK